MFGGAWQCLHCWFPGKGGDKMSGTAQPAQPAQGLPPEVEQQVDAVVKQRLEQAFGSMFGKVMTATEKMATAAEAQASIVKQEGLTKVMKVDSWKPASREEELRTWREWQFQFLTWVAAHDAKFSADLAAIDIDVPEDHALMEPAKAQRSQKLYAILVSLLRGRPLLLVKGLEKERAGLEAMRVLRKEMEPKERARSLALMRQLASWSFKEGGLHEQLVQFEEAVASYETASSKVYPEDLVIASVVGGLKEPLRSQVQLRMTSTTTYTEIRSWILQYEAVNTPWSTTLSSRGGGGSSHGGPQPMDVDQIWAKRKGDKGKKGDYKGKGKGEKGKKGDKGNYGQGGGWKQQPGQWTQPGQWSQAGGWKQQPGQWGQQGQWGAKGGGYKQQQGGQNKGGKGKGKGQCHVCGQTGHWKWECPFKGKGKGVNQVDASSSSASTAPSATSTSTAPSSATAFNNKTGGFGVNRVEVSLGTPPGYEVTQLFDFSVLEDGEDFGDFSLEPAEVMVIRACEPSWLDTLDDHWGVGEAPLAASNGPEEFAMDASDWDGDWTVPWYEPNAQEEVIASIRAVSAYGREVEVVVDSGADISVAPCAFAELGSPSTSAAVTMHDAQGKEIVELGNRVLDIEVRSLEGETVTIREKFAVANVGSLILSLGRLLRWGWELGHEGGGPVIKRNGCRLPIRLRRNTLTMLGIVSLISASCGQPAAEAAKVNAASVFDDFGALPPEAEELVARPGWHILGSGLPFLVAHRTEAMHWEQNLWSSEDWSWAAVFVRAEPATRLPRAGDLWYQVAALQTSTLEAIPEQVSDFNDELTGPRDVCVLFHVSELPKDLLSNPQEDTKESRDDNGNMDIAVPFGEVEGGAGAMPEEVVAAERELVEEEPEGEVMDGVTLAFETPLRDLRALCQRQGLAASGSKAKVLRRLKQHYEVLERQLAGQLAHKLFMEEDRPPDLPRAPRLPSARQQDLRNATHHPYASWCEACVLGRAKASPHQHQSSQKGEAKEQDDDGIPLFQIDYTPTPLPRSGPRTMEMKKGSRAMSRRWTLLTTRTSTGLLWLGPRSRLAGALPSRFCRRGRQLFGESWSS